MTYLLAFLVGAVLGLAAAAVLAALGFRLVRRSRTS
jgi:hypothetical protein